jgi:hypothetical protein
MQLTLRADAEPAAARYLFGAEAEVAVWERLWAKHKGMRSRLEYDVLSAPHHCSSHNPIVGYVVEEGRRREGLCARSALR